MPRDVPTTSPRKLPKQERSRVTVEAILDATAIVLTREGYGRTNTNRVARVAGVSIGSLYQYFPNKESLISALVSRHQEQIKSAVGPKFSALIGAPLPAAVRELVEAVIALHNVDPELHRALAEQYPRAARHDRRGSMDPQILEMVRTFLQAHSLEIRPKNLELAAFIVAQTVESLTHAVVLEYPEYLRDSDLVDDIVALLLGYLSPESSQHEQ